MLTALTPAVDSMLGLAPAVAGGLSVAVWVVWGVGSVFLIVLGFVVTGLIAALRRRAPFLAAPARGPAAAG
jgi:threonine/homoserine/homoserine lactone efflux protein